MLLPVAGKVWLFQDKFTEVKSNSWELATVKVHFAEMENSLSTTLVEKKIVKEVVSISNTTNVYCS